MLDESEIRYELIDGTIVVSPPARWVLPDVQVVRADSPQLRNRAPALLVVEVLSPGTRWKDLGRKREVYATVGVPTCWLVDPVARELVVLTLTDGDWVETARGSRLALTAPFPVNLDLG